MNCCCHMLSHVVTTTPHIPRISAKEPYFLMNSICFLVRSQAIKSPESSSLLSAMASIAMLNDRIQRVHIYIYIRIYIYIYLVSVSDNCAPQNPMVHYKVNHHVSYGGDYLGRRTNFQTSLNTILLVIYPILSQCLVLKIPII